MSRWQDNLIVALDIGSAWTRVLVADLHDNALRYCGYGVVESAGMRKGLIAELAPAARAVKAASEQAERVAGVNIDRCVVGIGGPHIRGLNTNGGVDLDSRSCEITRDDMRAAVERARALEWPPDREILHLLPRQFIVDGEEGIYDPFGMIGVRLEVDLHIATSSGSALQSAITCANRAGLEATEVVLESIAAAEATLTADERELGVCLLDIGEHSSDLVVYFEGAVVHTASIPIGGSHFTRDMAVVLGLPLAQADELKRRYGQAVVTDVSELAEIEIAGPELRRLRLREIAEILEPRTRELLHYVKKSLRDAGVLEALGAGCVLTGGGAMLSGLPYIAESHLSVPARVGRPVRLTHMPSELVHPAFAVAVGMVLYAHRTRASRAAETKTLRSRLRTMFAASF